MFQKLVAGALSDKSAKEKAVKRFVAICECGQLFKSENGYKMHLEQNKTTHSGQCVERMRRRMERQEALQRTRAVPMSEQEDQFLQSLDGNQVGNETTMISEQEITES